MATYSIKQIEHLTGIQAHTLRTWERRYGLIKANRTNTKIRYYDDDQLKLLLNVSILIEHGFRVSTIDKMSIDEIFTTTQKFLMAESTGLDDIQGLTMSMHTLDEDLFNRIYKGYFDRHGLKRTVIDLLYPFLNHVGILWCTNKAMPAQEHFVSNLIRRKIFSAIENLPTPNPKAPLFILFLPEGDYHEIGLLLSYYLIRNAGFNTYYLGQNVPSSNVILLDEMVKADYVMSILLAPGMNSRDHLNYVIKYTNAKILLAGKVDGLEEISKDVTVFISPNDFENFLDMNQKDTPFV